MQYKSTLVNPRPVHDCGTLLAAVAWSFTSAGIIRDPCVRYTEMFMCHRDFVYRYMRMNPGGQSRSGGSRGGRGEFCACPDCIRARRADKARRREENQEYLSRIKAERCV
jgi:hypothetical protein